MPWNWEMETYTLKGTGRTYYVCKNCKRQFWSTPPMFHTCPTGDRWHELQAHLGKLKNDHSRCPGCPVCKPPTRGESS